MTFAFTEAEHRTRIERARQTLAEKRLDGAICVAPEHILYFGGYDAHTHFSEQALVFTVDDDEPTFVMRDADRACATETSWVEDVRWGYGVGIGYPPAWLEPLDVVLDSKQVWQPGMVFCLHVELNLVAEGLGLVVGGDYLLNSDGIEALDSTGGGPEKWPLVVV